MNHSKLRSSFNDYVDRQLPGRQRAEVSAHLAECSECATEVRELEHTLALLRRLPDPDPPLGFADAVMARVRAGEAEPRRWLPDLRALLQPTLTVTATAAVAGLAVFVVIRGDGTPGTPEPATLTTASVETPSAVSESLPVEVARTVPAEESVRAARSRAMGNEIVHELRVRRRANQLARRGYAEEVARMFRGAGHPHSGILAAHFEERRDEDRIQLTVASQATPRRTRR